MWPTMLNPQGPAVPSLLTVPNMKQQHRHLAMFSPPVPINGGKSFKNPNFVNCDFDKYRPKSLDCFAHKSSQEQQNKTPCETPDLSVQALELSFNSKPMDHTLGDFIIPTPSSPTSLKQHNVDSLQMLLTLKASPSPRRYSVSDSEDSFILFAEPEQPNSSSKNSTGRTRRPSCCESEDSFVVFEGDDDSNIQDDSSFIDSSDSDEDSDDSEGSCLEDKGCDEVDCHLVEKQKKVTFAATEKLCEVHPMIKWSYAYQAARKGPWEMYARDRTRFRDRALKVERDIKHVFDPQHRDKIYRQRFQNL